MGLLSNTSGSQANKKPADDALLLHAIMSMAAADGIIEDAEHQMVRAYANTLPEYKDMDCDEFNHVFTQAAKVASRFKTGLESISALSDIQSEAIRRKAFVLAVDVALSSGDVDEAEDHMLAKMQNTLGIDDALAAKIIEVVSMKYSV